MKEAEVLRALRVELGGRRDVVLWRNHVGVARYPDGRSVPYGLARGAADLIGIRSLVITPEHVGQTIGQFVAIEAKSPTGRPSREQEQFLELVRRYGGHGVLARSVEDF